MQMDSTWLGGLLDRGSAANVKRFLSLPTLNLNVTISFVRIPVVGMNVSLTRGETSLEKMMEPIGGLMTTVGKFVSQPSSYDGVMSGSEYAKAMRNRHE